MPAEWKLSPVRRHSKPRTVGPEPQAARIDSRGTNRRCQRVEIRREMRRRELPDDDEPRIPASLLGCLRVAGFALPKNGKASPLSLCLEMMKVGRVTMGD